MGEQEELRKLEILINDESIIRLIEGLPDFKHVCPVCGDAGENVYHKLNPRQMTLDTDKKGRVGFMNLGLVQVETCYKCEHTVTKIQKWEIPMHEWLMLTPKKTNWLTRVQNTFVAGLWLGLGIWAAEPMFHQVPITTHAPYIVAGCLLGITVCVIIQKYKAGDYARNKKH